MSLFPKTSAFVLFDRPAVPAQDAMVKLAEIQQAEVDFRRYRDGLQRISDVLRSDGDLEDDVLAAVGILDELRID